MTAASVIATSFAVPFVSAVNAAEANPVVMFRDFESGGSWHDNDAPVEDTGDSEHGKAAKYRLNSYLNTSGEEPTPVAARFSCIEYGNSFAPKGRYIVSYDVKLTSNQQGYRFMLRDSEGVDFAFIDFTNDNRIITGKTGSGAEVGNKNTDYSTSEVLNACGRYDVNQWYNITIAVDPKDNGGSEIAYYLDGKLLSTANASGKVKSNGKAAKMYLGAYKTLDENGNIQYPTGTYMWIDNYTVQYADSAYYTALTNSAPKVNGNTITVDFIEPICIDGYEMSDIKLYDSKNSEVPGITATVSGKILKITGATLTNGEYHIALPAAFKGVSGVTPQMDVISFVNGAEFKTSGDIAWVVNHDMQDLTSGTPSYFVQQGLTGELVTESNGNKALKPVLASGWTEGWGNYLYWEKDGNGKQFADVNYNLSDIMVYSSDYYLQKDTIDTSKVKKTGTIYGVLEGNESGVTKCQFLKYYFEGNNFKFAPDIANNAFNEYSGITPETWYTVISVIDTVNGTTDYYLKKAGESEKYVGRSKFNAAWYEKGLFSIVHQLYSANSVKTAGDYYIDNVKIGYQVDKDYKKVIDSQDDEKESHRLETGKNIRDNNSYLLNFNVNLADLSENRDFSVVVANNETHSNAGLRFRIDTSGKLTMSSSLIDAYKATISSTNDNIIDLKTTLSANTVFNVKIYVDKSIDKTNTALKDAYVFINDKCVRAFRLAWGLESWGGAAIFTEHNNLTTVTGSDNAKISNFKLGYTSKIPYIESAVIYNQNDNMGHAFVSQNIKSDIQNIVLNVADKSYATNDTLTAGTAKLTNGTSEIELNVDVQDSQIVLTTKDGAYVPNGKWTLNYTGSDDCGDYTADFTVNETRTLVDNSNLTVTGTTAELTGTIQNFEAKKKVSVIIAEYSADNPKRLVNVFTKEVELQSGTNTLNELKLTGSTESKNNYKAFIWETISGMAPVFSAKTAE